MSIHIIWDFDGTLINSEPEIKEVLEESIKEAGFADIDQIIPFRSGPPLDIVLKNMYGEKLSLENINSIISIFRNRYDNCGFRHTLPYDGIEECLRNIKFIHHIVTNKPDIATNKIIEKLNWKKYFASVITPYSYLKTKKDKRKTKSELFSICVDTYQNDRFVSIGDMVSDAKAAIDNNIPFIGVLWGTGTKEEFKEFGCNRIAENVNDLIRILNNL